MNTVTFVLLFVASCSCEIEFSSRSRNFSLELVYFTQMKTEGHVVLSPFGIWTLMTGVALGTMGDSYDQLRRTFVLPNSPKTLIEGFKKLSKTVLNPTTPEVSLSSKNFLFLDEGFDVNKNFQTVISADFGAMIKVLNFKDPDTAANIANNMIQNSGGRVSNVLSSDDFSESRMILSNVISFKGLWSSPFNKSETTIAPFYNERREIIGQVNMMYQRAPLPFSNNRDLQAFVLELPYGTDGKYSMLVVLPYAKAKVIDVYRRFSKVSLKDIFSKFQRDLQEFGDFDEVDVSLPRFKISTNVVLNRPLNDMGVYDIFQPDIANFGRVTKDKIYVSAIVHKADIEVTESGTVASAATSAVFADRISTPSFKADKPFIYFVMEKTTTTMIFGGIYSKPTVF